VLRICNHFGAVTDIVVCRLLGHFTSQRTVQEVTPVDPLKALEALTLNIVFPELV
jgi:hypothetical protein